MLGLIIPIPMRRKACRCRLIYLSKTASQASDAGMPEVFGVTGPLTYWPLASPFFSPGPFLPYFWASHLPHPTP